MNVTGAWVEWKPGYDNPPKLHAEVDEEPPERDEFTFRPESGRRFWWAEKDGIYRHFAGHPDEPGDGFGGASFTLATPDGEVTLEGPYSSRAGVVNAHGHGPCTAIVLHTPSGGHRTATVALEIAERAAELAGVTLERVERTAGPDGEFDFEVAERHPPEWTWDADDSDDRTMPWGPGTFTHPDGSRISLREVRWTESTLRREYDVSGFHAVLYAPDGEPVDEAVHARADLTYHYLMAVHADEEPEGEAKRVPAQTEKRLSGAGGLDSGLSA